MDQLRGAFSAGCLACPKHGLDRRVYLRRLYSEDATTLSWPSLPQRRGRAARREPYTRCHSSTCLCSTPPCKNGGELSSSRPPSTAKKRGMAVPQRSGHHDTSM